MVKAVAQGDNSLVSLDHRPRGGGPRGRGDAAGHDRRGRSTRRCAAWPKSGAQRIERRNRRHEHPRPDVGEAVPCNRLPQSKNCSMSSNAFPAWARSRRSVWRIGSCNADRATALRLAQAIVEVKDTVHFCCALLQLRRGRRVRRSAARPSRDQQHASAWSASRATSRPSSAPPCSRACTTCWGAPCRLWRASVPMTFAFAQLDASVWAAEERAGSGAGHQPQCGRGDHGRLSRAPDQAPGYRRSRVLPAACPSAATWSSPTR